MVIYVINQSTDGLPVCSAQQQLVLAQPINLCAVPPPSKVFQTVTKYVAFVTIALMGDFSPAFGTNVVDQDIPGGPPTAG